MQCPSHGTKIMKIGLYLLLVLWAAAAQPVAAAEAIKIILDTDMDGDIDDVGALAMLHAMADNGKIEILATMVSSLHEWSVPATSVINTYYNRPNLPIGAPKGRGDNPDSRYARKLAEKFPHNLASNAAAPDAVELYREILSRQPDNSVVKESWSK